MLHYNPRHVSSSTMLILRRSYCIITASGIVTLCKRPYSTPVESGLRERLSGNFAYIASLFTPLGIFTCRKSTTWDRRLYFPSEGRRAEDFFTLKNLTASVGFEPANLGTKGQHATPRPPKPHECPTYIKILT